MTVVVAGFYGIADADAALGDVLELARALLAAGVPILQLRMKGRPEGEIRGVLEALAPESAAAGAALVLNDHPRLAAEFAGVGVHLGQADAPPEEARSLLGPDVLIGWSTHDLEQIRLAASKPVDYVGFGPVFSAAGKHLSPTDRRAPDAPRGLAALRRATSTSSVPVVAIGGIGRAERADVLATGVHAVAAIGAVARAPDPVAEARDWTEACRR